MLERDHDPTPPEKGVTFCAETFADLYEGQDADNLTII